MGSIVYAIDSRNAQRAQVHEGKAIIMKKFRTAGAVIIMALAAVIGIFVGAALGDAVGGAILLTLIAGTGCIVYAIDNRNA